MVISLWVVLPNIMRDFRHKIHSSYSSLASADFNKRMDHILHDLGRDLANSMGDQLVAVVVGGSYGRGEGRFFPSSSVLGSGVWSVGQAPIDDIELLVVTTRGNNLVQRKSAPVLRKYSEIIGVQVSVILSISQENLTSVRRSISWYQLSRSHVVIYGPEDVLDPVRALFVFDSPKEMRPGFTNVDAIRFHYSCAIIALQSIYSHHPSKLSYVKHMQRLADALFFASGIWQATNASRFSMIEAIVSREPWFLQNKQQTELLVTAFKELEKADKHSMGVPTVSDWRTFFRLWLFVTAYISRTEKFQTYRIERLCNSLVNKLVHAIVDDSKKSGFLGLLFLGLLAKTRPGAL